GKAAAIKGSRNGSAKVQVIEESKSKAGKVR
ncbi:MAG: hypothetical protein ACI9GZ_004593, partial [Bacteroidia bacterium]